MVAIGRELRSRGIDVVISISEPYAPIAKAAGLDAQTIISTDQFYEMVGDPAVWKTVRGIRRVLRAMSDYYVKPHHEVIRKFHRPGQTVLVSHPLDYASRVVRDSDPTTPLVNVHLQPVVLRMPESPTRLTSWWFEPTGPPWLIRAAYFLADHLAADPVIRPVVNQLRQEYSLPPIRRVLDKWWLSPDRIIALYPKWFAPETDVYAPRLMHAGFPLQDLDESEFVAPANRPIVFTAGTAHHHSRKFFEHAARACQQLGRDGILLSSHADNFPDNLPASVKPCAYVSLAALLPHCSAIVHHGGVGTTAQAIAAAIPQVIRPMAFDQFDNAVRIEKIGCGVWLRKDKALATTLKELIDSETVRKKCGEAAIKLQGSNGAKVAADEIESMLHNSQEPADS